MSNTKINVMLVDDHTVVRMGFKLLLQGSDDIHVIGEAQSGEEAVKQFQDLAPDVLVLDISMPGIGGLETIARVLAKAPQQKILVLSAHEDVMHARRVLKAGAAGYVTKRSAAEVLMQAIRAVHKGQIYLEPDIAQAMAVEQVSGSKNPVDALTEKEFKVFIELAKGRSVQEIADALSLSPRTIGTHLYNIKQKLGAGNSAELAIIAIRAGLIAP